MFIPRLLVRVGGFLILKDMDSYVLYDPNEPVVRKKRNCAKITFTDEQRDWLIAHFSTTLNKDCADHLGVSMRTMIRFARELGLEKDKEWLHGVFVERCTMMAEANRGEGNHGKTNLLKYGKQYRFKKGETSRQRLGEEKERERIRKAVESLRETRRKERMRVNWGLEQQTKLKIGHNKKKTVMRHTLKKRGYIIPFRGASVAYYTDNTDRSAIVERRAKDVGIEIKGYGY